MEKAKNGSCAQVIRHRDRYTILLQPLPTENYSNFEVRDFLIMSTKTKQKKLEAFYIVFFNNRRKQ